MENMNLQTEIKWPLFRISEKKMLMISLLTAHMALTTTKKKVHANRLLDQEEYFIYMYISQIIREYRQTCTNRLSM